MSGAPAWTCRETVVACMRVCERGEAKREMSRAFGARGLAAAAGCKHFAMEATGVYWKPVWHEQQPSQTCNHRRFQ